MRKNLFLLITIVIFYLVLNSQASQNFFTFHCDEPPGPYIKELFQITEEITLPVEIPVTAEVIIKTPLPVDLLIPKPSKKILFP